MKFVLLNMAAGGEDKDFKKEFDRQFKYLKNGKLSFSVVCNFWCVWIQFVWLWFLNWFFFVKSDEKKYKTKNPEVSRAYAEEAEKLKQRYEARSPKLMEELRQWHAMSKLQEAVFNKFPYGPKPK